MKFIVEIPDNDYLAGPGALLEFLRAHGGNSIEVTAADKPSFVLIQEGGASTEQYLHAHPTEDEAEADRYSCRDDGSYRTSPVVEIDPVLASLGEIFYEAVEAIMEAALDLDYPEGDNPYEDDERAGLRAATSADLSLRADVFWEDPDNAISSGWYRVTGINTGLDQPVQPDSIISITSEYGSQAEALLHELFVKELS